MTEQGPDSPKRSLMNRGERILLIIAAIIILLIALQKMGVKIFNRTDETEVIEHPHR